MGIFQSLPWEPTTFIFGNYNPYIGGVKPSFFMVLGSKGSQNGINRDFGPRTYRNNKLTCHSVTLGEKFSTLLKSLSGIPISNQKKHPTTQQVSLMMFFFTIALS